MFRPFFREEADRLYGELGVELATTMNNVLGNEDDLESLLFGVINEQLFRSHLNYAWKDDPSQPPYNPNLGVRRFPLVAHFKLEASIGLKRDGFEKPCLVIGLDKALKVDGGGVMQEKILKSDRFDEAIKKYKWRHLFSFWFILLKTRIITLRIIVCECIAHALGLKHTCRRLKRSD